MYLRAHKSWRDGQPNLAHGTETEKNKKIRKNKNRVAQKKRSGQTSVKAVREEVVQDLITSVLTRSRDPTVWRQFCLLCSYLSALQSAVSTVQWPEWGCRRDKGSRFQRQGEAQRKERSVILREDDDGGRARVATDEERVLRGRWTEMRLWRYGGWVVVRTV